MEYVQSVECNKRYVGATSMNLSTDCTKQETDSVTEYETVVESPSPQAYSPISLSNRKVFRTSSYTKQHSKGLLTPCRQVGLRRKSPRNGISPSDDDSKLSLTPTSSRFISPGGNCKGHRKFSGRVVYEHILSEEENSKSMGKRLNLEDMNENSKQCKYEVAKEPIHYKREERTTAKIQTENFNNRDRQSNIDVLSCKYADLQSNSYEACNFISSESSDRERSIGKTKIEILNDGIQQCTPDIPSREDLDLQNNSNDEHSMMNAQGTNGQRAIEKIQMENLGNKTQQCKAHTPSCEDFDFQSNSSNEDSMISSDSITECTEENLRILKQQIAVKEEEVKRLKLILLYKRKVINNDLTNQLSVPLCD